jgi:hypothetical protein
MTDQGQEFWALVTSVVRAPSVVALNGSSPRSKFGRRAAAVRHQFTLAHESGHAVLGAVAIQVAGYVSDVDQAAARPHVAPRRLIRTTVDSVKDVLLEEVVTASTDAWAADNVAGDPAPLSRYSRLRAVHPDFFEPVHRAHPTRASSNGGRVTISAGRSLLTRSRARLIARASTATARDGLGVLLRCRDLARSAAVRHVLEPPEPRQPPGRRVTSRRRPLRGPNSRGALET